MKTRAQTRAKSKRGTRPVSRGAARRVASSSRSRQGGGSRTQAPTAGGKRGSTSARRTAKSKRTRDHDTIQEWVETRGGHPAMVKATERGGQNKQGVLRIDFPGFSGEGSLEHVSWEDWFEVFDNRGLEFVYQEKAANGKQSRFNKLVSAS